MKNITVTIIIINYYYCCVYLGLVGSSSKFSAEQVAPNNLRPLGISYNFCSSKQCSFWEKLFTVLYNFFRKTFNLFDITLRDPFTTGTTTICDKFQIFFTPYLSLLFLPTFSYSVNSILFSPGTAISIRWHFFSFLNSTTMSGLLCKVTWSVWLSKSHNILILLFSTTLADLWLYHLTSPTKPNFWNSFKCAILAVLSCLFLYSFWTSFSHSAVKWVIILIPIGYQFSFLSSLFLGLVFVLQISSTLCFFLQITFPISSLCLITSNFFCFSYKFAMEVFVFPLHVSFFLFLFFNCRYRFFIFWQISLTVRKSQKSFLQLI